MSTAKVDSVKRTYLHYSECNASRLEGATGGAFAFQNLALTREASPGGHHGTTVQQDQGAKRRQPSRRSSKFHLFGHLSDAVASRLADAVVVQLARHAVVVRNILGVLAHHLTPGLAHEHTPGLLGEELHAVRKVVPFKIRNEREGGQVLSDVRSGTG